MNQLIRINILFFAACFFLAVVHAQELDKPAKSQVEMLTARVLVLDPDGNPLEGATVYCTGLRSKIEPGSHWGWDDEYGPLPKILTGADGIAAMPYPKYLTEKIETGTMTWSVEHPEFVDFREDRSVSDDPAEVRLKRGFKIAVTAVDGESGEAIQSDLYALVSGSGLTKPWKLADNGTLISPVFDHQQSVMRVMKIVEGQPVLFSDLIPIDSEGKSRVLLRDVQLTSGIRVRGRLDDAVPRPVLNGYVSATLANESATNPRDRNTRWTWSDSAPIAADGTFEFESLPEGVLQMIPVCDGWVPMNPAKEDILRFFPDERDFGNTRFALPQMIRIERGIPAEPVLKMQEATDCEITVHDPDGNPLPDATVAMWPNQYWFHQGSQILGTNFRFAEWLVKVSRGDLERNRENRYSAKTDSNGVAIIRNLPVRPQSLVVQHSEFEMPIAGRDRSASIELKQGETARMTIQLQKKGTDVLGQDKVDDDGDR